MGVLTFVALEHIAGAIEQDVGRQHVGTVAAHRLAPGIEALLLRHLILRYETIPRALVLILADADHLKLVAAVGCLQLF
jgi:hypothetical protein